MNFAFFNGLGAVFSINILAWFQGLGITMVVFGCVYAFVRGVSFLFRLH